MSKRLPLLQNGKELSFELPCALLEARGDERVCGDYDHRPSACRAFECKVLTGYRDGAIARTDAFALVRKARRLVTRVEERLSGASLYASFSTKLDAVADGVGQAPSPSERKPDLETLLDLGALRSVTKAFHDHDSDPSSSDADTTELLARAANPGEWERLFASVGGDALGAAKALVPSPPGGSMAELHAKGYARLGPVLAPEEAKALGSIVSGLAADGWPAVFVFMDPRVWGIQRRLEPWLRTALGKSYELLPTVWASDARRTGDRPRRARSDVAIATDGAPEAITVWIALSDATPDSGCVCILPPACDPFYSLTTANVDVKDVQNVRVLPAAAGTALAWNHRVLYWNARPSSPAENPCMSLAFEFRRAGTLEGTNANDRVRAPSFRERLAFIAAQILRNRRFGVDPRFAGLAARLASPSAEPPADLRR